MANYMPSNALCSMLGCKEPHAVRSSLCSKHGGSKADTVERKASNGMYQTALWRGIRARQLSKQPLCASCLCSGRVSEAAHVDHVFPWNKIGKHAFAANLFQSLCHECHSVKTANEQRGACMHYINGVAKEYKLSAYNYVVCQEQRETN